MLDPRLLKKLLQERILSQGSPGAQPFAMGGDVASQVKQALQPISPVGDNTQDIYGRGLSPVPERGPMISGADDQGIGNMGDRMRGIQGASGGGGKDGLGIGQIIGLALEGFASGAQGRAPQGPGLLMRGQEMRNQQGIANRKLEMDEQEFQAKQKESEAKQGLRDKLSSAAESLRDPSGDFTGKMSTIIGAMLEAGDSSAAVAGLKMMQDEKTRTGIQEFLKTSASKSPEELSKAALGTGDQNVIEWAKGVLPLFRAAAPEASTTPALVHVEAAKKMHPNDPVAQSTFIKEAQRNPESPANARYFEVLKSTGDHNKALNEYIQIQSAAAYPRAFESSKGREEGALSVKTGKPYLQSQQDIANVRARGAGQIKAEREIIGQLGTQSLLADVQALSDKLPAGGPGLDRFIVGGKLNVEAFMQSNPDAAELQRKTQAYSNILNRSVLAERGVLTDADREYAMKALPRLTDTKEMRNRNIASLRKLNELMIRSETQLAEGKSLLDVGATFRKDFDKFKADNEKKQKESFDDYMKKLGAGR